jgi:hypothetical protein
VCTEFPKDKEFRAFEMLEKIGFSLKPRRCDGIDKQSRAGMRVVFDVTRYLEGGHMA